MNTAGTTERAGVASQWNRAAVAHLLDDTSCPVCGAEALRNGCCRNCRADLTGDIGTELWQASQDAVTALYARQSVIERVPRSPLPVRAVPGPQTDVPPPSAAPAMPVDIAPRSSATVQSVLAVAGAGLFAVSAIVFTFFNPDLTDRGMRSVIVGLVTMLFLGGAWLLARRALQFSAEVVGALGMVFVALDLYALAGLAPSSLSPWAFAAIGTLVSGSAMAAVSTRARIRTWLWISFLGLATVPAMLGFAGGTTMTAVLGHLGTAFAVLALVEVARVTARRFDGRLRAEQVALTVVQVTAVMIAVAQLGRIETATTGAYWLVITAVLAAIALLAVLAARNLVPRLWSAVAGASGVAAVTVLPFALDLATVGTTSWYLALTPAAGTVGLVALGVLLPTPAAVDRHAFRRGAFGLATASVFATGVAALIIGAGTVASTLAGSDLVGSVAETDGVLAIVGGLLASALGFGVFATATARGDATQAAWGANVGAFAVWLTVLAGLTLACTPGAQPWAQVMTALLVGIAATGALTVGARIRNLPFTMQFPLVVGAHLALVLAAVISWTNVTLTVWAGVAIVATIAAVARTVPSSRRFAHVGVGYAYALVIVATALADAGVGTIALLCLTTSVGLLGAIVATSAPWVKPSWWYSILVVTAVPFVIGVVQVVFERSGWTALSTGIMFLLAMTLLVSRRPGLGIMLRAIAAGLLVPSLAIVVVCLGAQVLVGSASPVTLPVIAIIVALVLPSAGAIGAALERRGIATRDVAVATIAIEASALLTGAIAVGLALVRVAAGLGTTFLVLLILATGAAATARWAKRRYGWWVAAACLTGALWCVWALAGVAVLEPYLLPPTLAAATIGMILTARGGHGVPLYSSGLTLAIVPTLVTLAVVGTGDTALAPWRGYGLVAASWVLLGLGVALGRRGSGALSALRAPTHAIAVVAGAGGALQGIRFGLGADAVAAGSTPLVVLCLGIGLAGAVPAAIAARASVPGPTHEAGAASGRWRFAPALLYVGLAAWPAIERDWFTIWTMWSLMLAYLAIMVVTAVRLRRGTTLPPVWFVFALAFVTAVVAWSPRDLRVEWFSLPLGLFLLLAGIIGLRGGHPDTTERGTFRSWPARWHGSWPLLAPGLSVMFLASILATFTDPQTWRAILVIAIALVAILVGSSLKLAAPFVLGIIVLPIENIFVFMVQIGRGIESMPWWITLAVVGAVLLIIAVTYERRAGEANTISARLRDLT